MSEVSELEHELDRQRRKVEEKRDKRNHFRKLAGDKSAKIHDLRDAAQEAHIERDDNRRRLALVRPRLQKIEVDGIAAEEQARFDRLNEVQEGLVDENEELTAILHRVLPNIAEQTKRREEVRDLRERFGDDLVHAVQRKDAIQQELEEARKDAASNPIKSEFFVPSEFNCREGGPVPTYMYDDLADLCNRVLDKMRQRFGPAHCNSGHRWRFYNIKIGGALFSYHEYEQRQNDPAADMTFATGSPADWAAFARSLGVGGVGQYASFCHVDTGPRRDWSG